MTQEKHDYQLIKFAADGSVLIVATHNGCMIKIVDANEGKLIDEVYRGHKAAVISSVSLR